MNIGIIFPKDSAAIFDEKNTNTFGGATVQMYTLAEAFSRRDDVEVFSYIPASVSHSETDRSCHMRSFTGGIIARLFHFHRSVRKDKIDVLLQQGLMPATVLLALYCRIMGIKFVFMFASDREVFGLHQTNNRAVFGFSLLIKMATMLCVQNTYQQTLVGRYKVSPILWRMGFHIHEGDHTSRHDDILWVARCDAIKQPDFMITIAEQLSPHHSTMICPAVDPVFFDEIKKRAEMVHNLSFIPMVPFTKTRDYFSVARVFVNTSVSEGFPQTFIQAVARGVPIVSFQVNPNNFITDFDCGIVCNGSMDTLRDAVALLMENDQVWKEKSANALRYAREYHDIDKNITILLQEIIKTPRL